jgi:UDP:flavonoid glycosyltransferase YjiC (YdhE family)
MRALVVTWGPGGNLPPLVGAARALRGRGHDVTVLASGETAAAVGEFRVLRYTRVEDPDVRVAFEAQAAAMMATAAGAALAFDVRDALAAARPDVVVADCMLPAAVAAARAGGIPVVSLVHFLYGLARTQMARRGGAWTTDLRALAETHRALGLAPPRDGLDAWEAAELVLVTAPRWLDVDAGEPAHVVHAGPLDVHPGRAGARRRVLLTFSTTVMEGQLALVERACAAVAGLDAVLTLGPAVRGARVPESVEVLAAADHDALLPECAAVVGHGGLGTVLRALAHGVPQVLLPLGRDQAFNAARVEELGAGLRLGPGEDIRAAVATVLAEPRFAAAAGAAAERIAAEAPDRSAAEAIERAAATRRAPSGPGTGGS